ncbi:MAG TPA: ABC transporter ATP-binding protein [Vicinamibacteria bacterium]|nr:ABC transporter ATP-binding protein [Vicinamibacteria bacterium]
MGASDLASVDALVVARGSFRLEVPSWRVAPGEVVGVVGPNGAGKTTLLEAVAGLRPVAAGQLRVFGLDPWSRPVEVRSALGFMSDDMALFELRVDRLLRMLSGYYPSWDAALVGQLLDRFEIDTRKKVSDLSRGQGTRLRLVTAMAFRPRLLVLDEPAAALDLSGRRRLLESVLEVVKDPERSVLVSSHALHDVERIADRLLVLGNGRVVQEGETAALVGQGRTLEEAVEAWGVA